MSTLTPEEIRFFQTGDPAVLTPQGVNNGEVAPPNPEMFALASDPATPPEQPAPPPEPPAPPPPAPTVATVADIERLRDMLAQSQSQVAQLQAQVVRSTAPQPPAPEPVPDPAVDPIGHLVHQIKATNEAVTQLQQQLSGQNEAQFQIAQINNFKTHVESLKNEFIKTTPDFMDAYNHLRTQRIADLKTFGYSDQQAAQAVGVEEFQVANQSLQRGVNPAQTFYEMAKRHGYAPKPAATPAAPPSERLAEIERAAAAARSLPRSPNQPETYTVEGLKGASDADLNKIVLDDKAWAKVFGQAEDDIFLPKR